jgi:hypothetical protein
MIFDPAAKIQTAKQHYSCHNRAKYYHAYSGRFLAACFTSFQRERCWLSPEKNGCDDSELNTHQLHSVMDVIGEELAGRASRKRPGAAPDR